MEIKKDNVFYRDWRNIPPKIDHAEGVYLYDVGGKRYLDGSGGPMVVGIGHKVQEIIDAMVDQAEMVCFPYVGHFRTEAQVRLAREVVGFAPSGMSRVYFVSGGSEATEVAIKLVRQYYLGKGQPSRTKIVARWQSYHGMTLGALALGGHTLYRKDYLPYLADFPHIPPPYCYRCHFGMEYPACETYCARYLEKVVKYEGKETIAGFISEPVTGSSLGAVVPPPEYFPIVRDICDRYDILLIVDEVITGFGRTGRNFGIDHWGVVPDVIITGKGISSGYFPLGAVIIHKKIFDLFDSKRPSFNLGYTYSGNPLSCAVGLAVLRYIKKHVLVERAAKMGAYLFRQFEHLKELPFVGDIRGKGLLLGIELVQDKRKKIPFERSRRIAETIVRKAFDEGLILLRGHGFEDGIVGDLLMIGPPFIVNEEEIKKISGILEKIIQETCES